MLCEEYGITILISRHLLSEIEKVDHTIGIMNHGKLLQEISMDAITNQNFAYIKFLVSDVSNDCEIIQGHSHIVLPADHPDAGDLRNVYGDDRYHVDLYADSGAAGSAVRNRPGTLRYHHDDRGNHGMLHDA